MDDINFVGRQKELDECLSHMGAPNSTLLISGPPGVGKTSFALRLGEKIAERDCVRFISAGPSDIASLARQFTAGTTRPNRTRKDDDPDPSAAQFVVKEWSEQVVIVDDAQALPAGSAELLYHLARFRVVRLLICVDSDQTGVPALERMQREQGCRFELDPLGRADSDALIEGLLDGPVAAGTKRRLWNATLGNPGLTRRIVDRGVQAGWLGQPDGIWELLRNLGDLPPVADPVRARIAALSPEAAIALRALALIGPIGLAEMEALVPAAHLEALVDAGLADVGVRPLTRRDGFESHAQNLVLDLRRPFYCEIVLSMLPSEEDVPVRRLLSQFLERHPQAATHATLRRTLLRLDSHDRPDDTTLMTAAVSANYLREHTNTEKVAGALWDATGTPESGELLGHALYHLGRFHRARDVLTAVAGYEGGDIPDSWRAGASVTLANTLFWGMGRSDEALRAIESALPRVKDPWRTKLKLASAAVLAYGGRPRDALGALSGLRSGPDRDPSGWAEVESVSSTALGLTTQAAERADAGLAATLRADADEFDTGPETLIIAKAFALTEAGRLDEAEMMMVFGHDLSGEQGAALGELWTAITLGRINLVRGRPATANRWFREAVIAGKRLMHRGLLRIALAGVGLAAFGRADLESLRVAVAAIDAIGQWPRTFLDSQVARCRAAAARLSDDSDTAARILREAAEWCRESSLHVFEVEILHDLARGGAATKADARRAQELASASESPLMVARADHVVAASAADPTLLMNACESLVAVGSLLNAAEAASQAARTLRASDDQRGATAVEKRAAELLESCEGASSPSLSDLNKPEPLTTREEEIVRLVKQGLTNRDIADQLVLSLRTVQNHIYRILAKTGAPDRESLTDDD